MADFGSKLRSLRSAKGLSQVGLARAAEMSSQYISDLELGKRGCPTGPILARLAEALNTSVDNLLDSSEASAPVSQEQDPTPGLTPQRRAELTRKLQDAQYTQHDIDMILGILERLSPTTHSD